MKISINAYGKKYIIESNKLDLQNGIDMIKLILKQIKENENK
jgi:hypothetical protein